MPKPLYNATVLFDIDYEFHCFSKLKIKSDAEKHIDTVAESSLESTILSKNTSLSIKGNITRPVLCGNRNFSINFFMLLRLCRDCFEDEAHVEATMEVVKESHQKIGPILFKMPLLFMGYRTKVVQRLIPLNGNDPKLLIFGKSSFSSISKFNLEITQKENSTYIIELISFIVGFHCL